MADKAISELVSAEQITATDMFVLEQNGTAKKLTGQVLLNWLTKAADGHGGIQSYELVKTEGLVKTYRFTLADQTQMDIQVTDGRGISSISKISTSGLIDTYQISYNDGTTGTFTVANGDKGDKGDNTYIWIKYASQEPTASSHSFGDIPDAWIGVYYGPLAAAPTDWQQYKWFRMKGDKGDPGDPATLISAAVTYQAGISGTVIPSGSWSSSIPTVSQGQYLWTRIVQQFNTGDPVTAYSVSRMGLDGLGAVVTVNNVPPDANGNVSVDAASVKAIPLTGGTLQGNLNMNGQKLSGLNTPTENDEAVPKAFVDKVSAAWNRLDNSDFTQFVAQAGIGGNHGTQAYAGDRWILDNGSVTGEANENGNGYRNITLNGTIRQIVANPLAVGVCGIEMESGTATVRYENGQVIITSSGGVIKNVQLCEGDVIPKYRAKGYGAELYECQWYYENSWYPADNKDGLNQYSSIAPTSAITDAFIYFNRSKRIVPTVTLYSGGEGKSSNWRYYKNAYKEAGNAQTAFRGGNRGFMVRVAPESGDSFTVAAAYEVDGHWEACADL